MSIFSRRAEKTPLGIYVHIPFCKSKCQYCDFYSLACKDDNLMDSCLGLEQVGGQVLVVSQFTLYGNCRKGRRPSFAEAAPPELGEAMYERFLELCGELGYPPQHGRFGADMKVESLNDGPVTLLLDTDQLQGPRH